MENILKRKNFYLFVLFISIFSIISAIYIEYILNQKPCELCLYQRYPYLAAIFISFFGYFYKDKILFFYVMILTFIISVILSGYHIGVEQDIFLGLASCSSENLNILDKSELLKSFDDISVSCKDVSFKLLGLSLATINFLLSVIIIIFGLVIFNYEKNR